MICKLTQKRITAASLLFSCVLATQAYAAKTHEVEVPMPTKRLERGHIIASSDLKVQVVDIRRLTKDALLQKEDLIGKEAARTLRPDRPIGAKFVRIPPAARSGQNVTIAFKLQNLTVQAKGRALEDGQKGDIIRVMNAASKSVIEAKVTGNGTVVIQ